MKKQWNLIVVLLLVLIIAVFSVINVEPVTVNYLFGKAEWPLILVIIGSVLLGSIISWFNWNDENLSTSTDFEKGCSKNR